MLEALLLRAVHHRKPWSRPFATSPALERSPLDNHRSNDQRSHTAQSSLKDHHKSYSVGGSEYLMSFPVFECTTHQIFHPSNQLDSRTRKEAGIWIDRQKQAFPMDPAKIRLSSKMDPGACSPIEQS